MSHATALDAPAARRSGDDGRTVGELVGRDKFVVGDLTNTYAAIGAGASVIVQKARSRVGEIKREERFIEERLADGLEAQLDRYRRLAEIPAFASRVNPYRALKSYEIEHAGLFYGRGADIDRLWGYLDRPLSVVRAESGAGKSSLLKAGLASRLLAGGHLPIYLRPIDRYPGDELKAWFAADFDTQPGYERLRADSLTGFLERVTRLLGVGRVVVILLDQFEEFFYYQPEGERKRFAAELADCVERLRGSVRWLFAIRDEKYSGFGEFHPAINLSFQDTYALRWTPAQARETIIEPARLCGLSYEPQLPDRMITDLTEDGRTLSPLHLQLVCHTLFETHHAATRGRSTRPTTTGWAGRGACWSTTSRTCWPAAPTRPTARRRASCWGSWSRATFGATGARRRRCWPSGAPPRPSRGWRCPTSSTPWWPTACW